MNKTDQLINALSERFRSPFRDSAQVDALVLGYFRGFMGVLEGSDDKLAAALEWHLHDALEYNNEQSRLQEVA
jgi:hypothetical protein